MRAWGLHRDGGDTGKGSGFTASRFRSSTRLNVTLHLALPSFFPLAFCARQEWLSCPPWPWGAGGRGGRELLGNSLES